MKPLHIAALGAAIAMPVLAAAPAHAQPPDPARHIRCEGKADAAQVDALKVLPGGKVEFKISTWTETFRGVADPRNPKYSMAKQVLALGGKKYFCLHD